MPDIHEDIYEWTDDLGDQHCVKLPDADLRQYKVFCVLEGNQFYYVWKVARSSVHWVELAGPDAYRISAGHATIQGAESWAIDAAKKSASASTEE